MKDPFFVGYLPAPRELRLFLISTAVSAIAFFALAAVVLGLAQDDPGPGAQLPGRETVTGTLEVLPYPILHITQGSERLPAGTSIMLAGQGKNGVLDRAQPLSTGPVTASGALLKRGDLDMLQLRGGTRGLVAATDPSAPAPGPQPLGQWRLAGEICDGKCLAGAMRPGRGLAHKACAILCIDGGIPPVFVSSQPVEGHEFLMVTGPNGSPLPLRAERHIGQYISATGTITRHGTLLVFAVDPTSIEVLP